MTKISFYHLLHTPLETALPKLMEKVLISGAKAVIRTNSGERAEALSNILWTYKPDTFLPHGTARDGNADKQPIWITPDEENPNCAEILVLTDGALAGDLSTWQRCIEIFDGRNESAVSEARLRWSFYKSTRYELTYWQQMEGGGWEKRR
ncbi:MAG: DNA polymerase III subunit chi [Pseudomonadota bacterium]|nr:DNA polymerase III subunit chi [Pseudomonadota bacterium]MEC8726943.1 DNA polymerase III subunit chi [Pseudomonadota bacterium]